jgi:hypothetical protein
MPPTIAIVGLCIITAAFLSAGVMWVVSPRLFVQSYRRMYPKDTRAQSVEWAEKVQTVEGRIAGVFFIVIGIGGLYILGKTYHLF